MAKTRAKKEAPITTTEPTTITKRIHSLPPQSAITPQVVILPRRASRGSRVVSLLNPRTAQRSRYLACPTTGFYEITKTSAPPSTPRSWLLCPAAEFDDTESTTKSITQTVKDADLFIATAIDPLFLSLSALQAQIDAEKRLFRLSDDLFEDLLDNKSSDLAEVWRWPVCRDMLETRLEATCEVVKVGGEKMYKLDEEKLLEELMRKAKAMSQGGFPRSMEERFVTKALEPPLLSQKSTNAPVHPIVSTEFSAETLREGTPSESTDSQTSKATSAGSAASTAATSVAEDEISAAADAIVPSAYASPGVIQLQRLRIAFNFMCSRYLAPNLAAKLKALLTADRSSVNFAPLEEYTKRLAQMRQEALLARSASDYSRKRSRDEEDDEKAEKKQKFDEEEKRRKAGESRGVKNLKKVNTSGMMKLSSFFAKK